MSILTKSQVRTFRTEYTVDGILVCLIAYIRHDDRYGNGHNSFSITGELYDRTINNGDSFTVLSTGKKRWLGSCGCLHEEIAAHFPDLRPLLKFHLCSTDGPMHYIANTVYHASSGDLQAARESAIWLDATEADLTAPGLTMRLEARLPAVMEAFREAVESLGMIY